MVRMIYVMSLLIALTFSQMPTAYLAPVSQPAPRYVDIQSNNFVIAQFDTQTIQYEKDPYLDDLLISAWIKAAPNEWTGRYNLSHYIIRSNKKEIMLLEQADFNGNGQVTAKTTRTYDPNSWTPVVPETPTEVWYTTVMKYVQANDKKLKEDYNHANGITTKKNLGTIFAPLFDFFSM